MIGDDGASALATSLEKNTTLEELMLYGARLCARWLGRGAMWRASTAGGGRARARAHDAERGSRLCSWAGGARAASSPVAGRVWLLPVGCVTLAVCGLGAVHAADNRIGDDVEEALEALLKDPLRAKKAADAAADKAVADKAAADKAAADKAAAAKAHQDAEDAQLAAAIAASLAISGPVTPSPPPLTLATSRFIDSYNQPEGAPDQLYALMTTERHTECH